jgi:hypothetical protein
MTSYNPDEIYAANRREMALEEQRRHEEGRQGPSGIGGWLILVMLGMVGSAVNILKDVAAHPDPVSTVYDALVLFGLFTVFVLFWLEKRIFPKFYIGFWLAVLAVKGAGLFMIVSGGESARPEDVKDVVSGIVGPAMWLAIWGSYLLVSKRVKNTFTK